MQASRSDRNSQVDWHPDWLASLTTRSNAAPEYLRPDPPISGFNGYHLSDVSHGASSNGSKIETVEEAHAAEENLSALQADELIIESNRDRAVKYALKLHTL
jgi:hypothetical protein